MAYYKRRYGEALEAFLRAGQLYGQIAGSSPGRVPQLTSIGAVYLKMTRTLEADQTLQEAERVASQVYGPENMRVAEILFFRLQALRKLGKHKEADRRHNR